MLQESLLLQRRLGDAAGVAACLNELGNVAFYQDAYDPARWYYTESLALRRAQGDRSAIAATRLCQESLALCRDLGSRQHIAANLESLGLLAALQGDARRAASLLGAADAMRTADAAARPPDEQAWYERAVAAVRCVLDADSFAGTWAAACAMAVADAIDLALAPGDGDGHPR